MFGKVYVVIAPEGLRLGDNTRHDEQEGETWLWTALSGLGFSITSPNMACHLLEKGSPCLTTMDSKAVDRGCLCWYPEMYCISVIVGNRDGRRSTSVQP